MNQEMLERLLVDRALGALPPDVEALLDAYLEMESARAPLRGEIDETVRLARQALAPPRPLSLPPLKLVPTPERTTAGTRRRTWWPAELAAAFVLGLGLGPWVWHQSHPAASRTEIAAVAAVEAVGHSFDATTRSPAFWSMARLTDAGSKIPLSPRPRISWTSPVRKPQLNPKS
jgi:hypothetical protein